MTDSQGTLLEQSTEPITFTIGEGEVFPAFEEALIGLSAGDTHTFTLQPEEAFGLWREELVFRVPRTHLQSKEDTPIETGQTLALHTPEGETLFVYVASADEESVELDANHPLAGQVLTYTIDVLRVE
jgi:FKBP-type peptidyl-prolyl cis-trans isomerase 2